MRWKSGASSAGLTKASLLKIYPGLTYRISQEPCRVIEGFLFLRFAKSEYPNIPKKSDGNLSANTCYLFGERFHSEGNN